MYLDYNVSSGPFLSYEIEIGDGPGPELDKNISHKYNHSVQMYEQHKTHFTIPNTYLLTVIQLSILSFFSYLSTNLLLGQALVP